MDLLILPQRARDAGLWLEVVDTSLKISGPRKAEPLVRLLAEHKAQVLDALRKVQEVQKVQGTESCGTSTEHDPRPCASALAPLRAKCPHLRVMVSDVERSVEVWLNQRDVLIVKPDPPKPLAVQRMSLATETDKGTA